MTIPVFNFSCPYLYTNTRQFELNAELDLENAKSMDADLGGIDQSEEEEKNIGVAERDVPYQTDNRIR